MSEEGNDISNLSAGHKWLIAVALSLGAGGNLLGLQKSGDTSDRYKGAQARADFQVRDNKIQALERTQALHLQHSAAYTEIINRLSHDIDELEAEMKSHKHYRND